MQQQVRQLTLVIEPTGGTTDRIEGVEGYFSGAAATLDMDNGTYGTPSNVALTFTKITSGADAGKWSATMRLRYGAAADGANPFRRQQPAARDAHQRPHDDARHVQY